MKRKEMAKKLISLLGVGIMAFMIGCGNGAGSTETSSNGGGSDELVIDCAGGATMEAMEKSMFEPFTEKTGTKITTVEGQDYAKLKAMVESGNVEWDIAYFDAYIIPKAEKDGLLEKIDWNVVKTKDELDSAVNSDYCVVYDLSTKNICYNTNTYSEENHPTTWAEFWDVEKFPGKRGLQKDPMPLFEIALLADGVSKEDMYPIDMDRVFKSLDKIKPYVSVWWESSAQAAQLLSDGEVDLIDAWSGRVLAAKDEGSPVGLELNQAILSPDVWVIPKGAKNKDKAMEFLAFQSQAQISADYVSLYPYGPGNSKAYDLLSEENYNKLMVTPEVRDSQLTISAEWWSENYDEAVERLSAWLLEG